MGERPQQGPKRLVIVGGGMAALRLIEELAQLCPGHHDITLIGREPCPPYNRVLLSRLVAGEVGLGDVALRPQSWYAERRVDLRLGSEVTALEPQARSITFGGGQRLAYDTLVLATGSEPVRPPIAGAHLPGVAAFRTLGDAGALMHTPAVAVVIGGGLLGVEAACGLRARGSQVTLVHIMPRLMERQLDERAAALLLRAVAQRGIDVVLSAQAAAIAGGCRAMRVALKDGRVLPADLVVIAAGVRPETALARSAGLRVKRGIVVDDRLETSAPGIHAIGECAEHRGEVYGLVEPAYAQARVLGQHLAGLPARYDGSPPVASLKVSGLSLVSMGVVDGQGEAIVLEDHGAAAYRKLVVCDGRLAGALLVGDVGDAAWYRELMERRTAIARFRAALAFGKAYAEAA
jgi:nitrite reductase (NADH) large subunit